MSISADPSVHRIIESTLEQMHEGIQVIGRDWTYLYVNHAVAKQGHRSREELLGRTMMECYPGIEKTDVFRVIRDCMECGVSHRMENEFEYPDKTKGWFELHIEPHAEGVLVRSFDISEKKKMQEQLWHAQKLDAIGRLSGELAHDLGNKFAIMTLSCEVALERAKDPALASALKSILSAVHQSSAVTRQLLAFSRKQALDLRVVNINDVLEGYQSTLPKLLGEKIQVRFILTKPLGNIRIDVSQLDQVILNLCVNARDAMPKGGALTIETSLVESHEGGAVAREGGRRGPHVLLSIADTGVGMSAEVRRQAFEPYFTTKERGQGTGLGLSTVHGIVQQCDGHIAVESAPGAGSVFRVYFPRVMEPETVVGAARARAARPKGSEMVLLVEDDPDLRDVMTLVLQNAGYRVVACRDAEEAKACFSTRRGEVDLLLTDVVMPRGGGLDLARELQAQAPALRAVFMSGYGDLASAREADGQRREATLANEAQVARILLRKPTSSQTLLQVVRDTLSGALSHGVF